MTLTPVNRLRLTIIGVSTQMIAVAILAFGNVYIANAFSGLGASIAWFLFAQLLGEVLKK